MQDYKSLIVWQKAHRLTLDIYKVTKDFPKDETYGLISQIRRASVSIPTNIVEGSGRSTQNDFARFLYISFGSGNELEYELLLAKDLSYLSKEKFDILSDQIIEIKKMLSGLIKKIS